MVVEHDDDTIRRASHIIDIGPGAGVRGAAWWPRAAPRTRSTPPNPSPAATWPIRSHPLQGRCPVEADTPMIQIRGARLHNLRHVDAQIPVGRLSVVTGVSGSGSPRWRAKCCWTT